MQDAAEKTKEENGGRVFSNIGKHRRYIPELLQEGRNAASPAF